MSPVSRSAADHRHARASFPEVSELRRFCPALRAAEEALEAEAERAGERFEPTEERLAREARDEVRELRRILDETDHREAEE